MELDDLYHIVRYCKPSTLDENGKPTHQSFTLRLQINEEYLSVDWFEYFKGETIEILQNICNALREKGLCPKLSGILAKLNNKTIKNKLLAGMKLIVNIYQIENSYSGIKPINFSFSKEDNLLMGRIIKEALEEKNIFKVPDVIN